VRDVFQTITEITKQDLNIIQQTLEKFGVTVRRPEYNNIDDFVDKNDVLIKPEICPRDTFVTIGDTLITPACIPSAWESIVNEYTRYHQKILPTGMNFIFNGANVVRVGKDIIVDTNSHSINDIDTTYFPKFSEYKITWEKNGGHMDGCFAILKPGLIIANHYYDGYERNFPGWECIFLNEPTYSRHRIYPPPEIGFNGKFYAEGVKFNKAFNDHVIQHAQSWVGNYTETFFELNCLVINESNVLMLGYNEALEKTLNSQGITVHWVPFRCRGFWDGGMHCITLDINRDSTVEDFFPERSK
jgi:N-dimethylarginine dimethylaminohydrolase